MSAWQVGDEAFARYYDQATSNYVPKLEGHVTGVGRDGFTIRLIRPDRQGRTVRHVRYDDSSWPGLWKTREEGEAHIAEHPFRVGPAKRAD